MLRNKLFWLGLVAGLGLFVRLWGNTVFPPSLNWDEVSHGYNAYSLLKTGRDEWGVAMPSIFRAFGDYKLPVYVYLTVPTFQNPRLPSIVFGTLTIIISGLLAYELSKKTQVMLAMAFLVALEPWTWFFSRIALEANVSLTLILLGVLLAIRRKNLVGLIFFWGLAMWTYNSARVFVPVALALTYMTNRTQIGQIVKKNLFAIGAVLLVLFVPVAMQMLSSSGTARFKWTSLLDQGALNRIDELRGSSPFGRTMSRMLYNKGTYFVVQSSISFASYFSPKYWLEIGGSQYQYTVQGHGLIFWSDIIWFGVGLMVLLKNRRLGWVMLAWFVLAIVPGSITRDAPHPLRSIYAIFPVLFVVALGVHKKIWPVFLLVTLGFFGQYLLVARDYSQNYSWSWQYGYEQTVHYLKAHDSEYDQILFTKRYGEPHEFLAYYLPIDPKTFQTTKMWDFHDDWYWINGFKKYTFVNDWEMIKTAKHIPGKKILVVCSPDNVVSGVIKDQVNFLNNKPAFILVEI